MLTERLFKLFLLWTVQCEKEQCVRVCFRANYLFTVLEVHIIAFVLGTQA